MPLLEPVYALFIPADAQSPVDERNEKSIQHRNCKAGAAISNLGNR
jgi:hypothetical protein